QHELRIACALESVNRDTALLDGETIERDDFTFLTAPFNGCPERTPVLRRTTNYGELLYLFSGVAIDDTGRLAFRKPAVYRGRRLVKASGAITPASVATAIAKGIAGGMVSAVGGAIANAILEKIFPPGVPTYFDKVYDEMKRIVGAQLQRATID